MNLPKEALIELKGILQKDIGLEVEDLKETKLEELGLFLLSIGVNSLKVRNRLQK